MKSLGLMILAVLASINAFAEELPSYFDGGLNELKIATPNKGVLGSYNFNCGGTVFQSVCLSNARRTEFAKFVAFPGGERYAAYRYEVVMKETDFPIFPNEGIGFISSKGIKLGMSKSDVIKLLGDPHQDASDSIQYTSVENNVITRQYNMPLYSAEYEFNNDKLVRFEYGFDYP